MARRAAGDEAESLAVEAETWILQNLGTSYEWPGNYRELEQCIRNLLIRRDYRPARGSRELDAGDVFAGLRDGKLTASDLLSRYCTLVYSQTHSYEETARRLDMDRRTVKSKVDEALLERLRGREG
jgi:transcriptional regulator of acetoin/glycerol metabolism